MVKLLLLVTTFAFCISADDVAQAGFNKLTESQKAQIIQSIESTASSTATPTVTTVDQWVSLGMKIGQALAGCAKELNLAVNDFMKTPAGKVATVLIVWKVMAIDILHIVGGLMILVVGLTLVRAYYKGCKIETRKYDPEKVDIFKRSRLKEIIYKELTGNEAVTVVIFAVLTVLAFIITWFTL
jgi:hypothetical protein